MHWFCQVNVSWTGEASARARELWDRRVAGVDAAQAWEPIATGSRELDLIGTLLLRILLASPTVFGLWVQKRMRTSFSPSDCHILSPDPPPKDLLPSRVDRRLSNMFLGLLLKPL